VAAKRLAVCEEHFARSRLTAIRLEICAWARRFLQLAGLLSSDGNGKRGNAVKTGESLGEKRAAESRDWKRPGARSAAEEGNFSEFARGVMQFGRYDELLAMSVARRYIDARTPRNAGKVNALGRRANRTLEFAAEIRPEDTLPLSSSPSPSPSLPSRDRFSFAR